MKKVLMVLLTLVFALTFYSCGLGEKQAGVYTYSDENISVEMTIFAKGDDISKIEQVSKLDISGYSSEKIKEVEANIKEMEKVCKSIDGVEYSTKKEKNKITETISVAVNEKTIEKIKKENLVPVEDQKAKNISLKKFTESLENSGWKLKK